MNQPGITQQGAASKKRSPARSILAATILVLILAAIYYVWHWQRYSRPHCADYKGVPGAACAQLAEACGSNRACLNAVAHCTPILARARRQRADPANPRHHHVGSVDGGLANYVEQAGLNACTRAIARIDPAFAARLLAGYGAPCVAADAAAPFQKEADYRTMVDVARAAEPLLPWAVRVAKEMPVCASSVAPPYAPVTPPYAPVSPPYGPLAPPYAPVNPPYAPLAPPYAPLALPYARVIPNVAPLLAPLALALSPLSPGKH